MCTKSPRMAWRRKIRPTQSTSYSTLDNSAHSPFQMKQDWEKLFSMRKTHTCKPRGHELKPMFQVFLQFAFKMGLCADFFPNFLPFYTITITQPWMSVMPQLQLGGLSPQLGDTEFRNTQWFPPESGVFLLLYKIQMHWMAILNTMFMFQA